MEGVDRSYQQLCQELKISQHIPAFDFNVVKACLVKGYIHRVYCLVDNRDPKYCNIFEKYPNGTLNSDSGLSGKEEWILATRYLILNPYVNHANSSAVALDKFTLLSLASPVLREMVLSSVDESYVPRHQVSVALFIKRQEPKKFARAKFDFQGAPAEGALSLRKGDVIEVLTWSYMGNCPYHLIFRVD
jgi:hypothetical protein